MSQKKRNPPNNWISLEEYERRRDLDAGTVTAERDGETPEAWVNTMTLRVVYRLSPFSSRLYLGELKKSNHVIKPESSVDLDSFAEPSEVIDEAFDYMEHDNGMTPIDRLVEN